MISVPYCFSTAAVDCGVPSVLQNGRRGGSRTTFGSTVTYICDRGYTPQGPMTRVCMANGQWSGSVHACNRKLSISVVLCISYNGSSNDNFMSLNNPRFSELLRLTHFCNYTIEYD